MAKPRSATTVRKTPNFDFIFGRYSHSHFEVPYFQVSMSFGDISTYLKLVSEMPGASAMNWRVEELFQRDIDWGRVTRKIVPYLKQQEQPHFFNSLTIALLPIRNGSIADYSAREFHPPALDNEQDLEVRHFGPLSCGYWQAWTQPEDDNARLGQLCWNTQEVCGVAIDGQHRLAAIKELGATTGTSSVPVILVVLHPTLGYVGNGIAAVIATLRRLFIDLNKHAQKVSRARQILLDDRDPSSICVRAFIGSQLTSGIDELTSNTPSLPLSLVDWHSEQARFDDGPYVTTILGTDWAIAKILNIRPFEDPMAHDQIERMITRLERLDIQLADAHIRNTECRKHERPFGFSDEDLAVIADGFRAKWCAPLIHLLTRLLPYGELIDLRRSRDTLRPEFANWYALKKSADDAKNATKASHLLTQYESELSNRSKDPIAPGDLVSAVQECDKLKRRRPLAFAVVFQRALLLAYLPYTRVSAQMLEQLGDVAEIEIDSDGQAEADVGTDIVTEMARAEGLVDALNHLIREEPAFLRSDCEFPVDEKNFDRFWLCSLVDPAGPIDFTQGASTRAADLLLLIGLFWSYRSVDGLKSGDFESLMDRADNASEGLDLKLFQCLQRMYSGESSIGGRIMKSRGLDAADNDANWKVIEKRAAWLWAAISK